MVNMKNVVLIGYMGSGKSTVGKILREKTDWLLLDSDVEIEKEQNKKISDIFKEQGEDTFRNMESEYLDKLAKMDESIILSTGGGMPMRKENADRMKKVGLVIYLRATAETIYGRLKDDTQRPLLQTGDKLTIITEMLERRNPVYESAADIIIDTDDNNLERVVNDIMELIQE